MRLSLSDFGCFVVYLFIKFSDWKWVVIHCFIAFYACMCFCSMLAGADAYFYEVTYEWFWMYCCLFIACLHDQNKNGFFGGPAFIQPIRTFWKVFKNPWLAGKKPALRNSHFCFDHVNKLIKLVLQHPFWHF